LNAAAVLVEDRAEGKNLLSECGRCGGPGPNVSVDTEGDEGWTRVPTRVIPICGKCLSAWCDRLVRVIVLAEKIQEKKPELFSKFQAIRERLMSDEEALGKIEKKLEEVA
jgi:hypothetical protein